MAVLAEAQRLYNALVGSGNISYATLPDGAASITLTAQAVAWTYGAWAEIVASVGAADAWLVGVGIEAPSDPAAGYDVDIGDGAAGSEVSIAEVPFFTALYNLPFPARILAATRLAGRTRSSTGVADTIGVKVVIILGV